MKTSPFPWLLCSVTLLVAGCAVPAPTTAVAPSAAAPALAGPAVVRPTGAPPELTNQKFLFQVARYLYRYHLDEAKIDHVVSNKQLVFWVRRLQPLQDPDDRSQFGEVMLPQLDYSVRLKLSDYRIEEQNQDIKSRGFKVYQVTEGEMPAQPPTGAEVVTMDVEALKDHLFQSRFQRDFPSPELLDRLRKVASEEMLRSGQKPLNLATGQPGENIVHVGPLSPVSNEIWTFWESGRKIYHFTSDIDLSNPSVWEVEHLKVDIYDLDHQVVTSHEEAPGSNRFLSRYEVGRVLYNCIVIGQRLELGANGVQVKSFSAPRPAPTSRPGT